MRSIFIVAALFTGLSSFAQSDFDQRLLSKFSQEQIANLQENNSASLDYWTYYLDHSYEIIPVPQGKSIDEFEVVKIKNLDNFNILDLELNMNRTTNQYYRIKGENLLLVLISNEKFVENFNQFRQNQ